MKPATASTTSRGRRALGKGLGALIAPPQFTNVNDDYFMCDLARIQPDPNQPRQHFDDAKLNELVASVKEKGILQPLLVRSEGRQYILIAGERRLRASKLAGLTQVPVVVKDVADDEAFEMALIENIQRDDLNPIEEAAAYQRLLDHPGSTQDIVARKVGKDRSTVANSVRLLRLPVEVQTHIIDGRISSGHARTILSVPQEHQQNLVDTILAKQMSVRQAEKTAKQLKGTAAVTKKKPVRDANSGPLAPYFATIATELGTALDTKVSVRSKGRQGQIQVTFDSVEDLRRLRDVIVAAAGLQQD